MRADRSKRVQPHHKRNSQRLQNTFSSASRSRPPRLFRSLSHSQLQHTHHANSAECMSGMATLVHTTTIARKKQIHSNKQQTYAGMLQQTITWHLPISRTDGARSTTRTPRYRTKNSTFWSDRFALSSDGGSWGWVSNELEIPPMYTPRQRSCSPQTPYPCS